MVGVAPVRRGINAARNELQSRPVGTKWLALGRRGSFMILIARFHGFTLRYSGRGSELCLTSLKMHHCARQRRQRRTAGRGPWAKIS